MNEFLSSVLTSTSSDISAVTVFATVIFSLVMGILISLTYVYTSKDTEYERGFPITLMMLPIILSVVILLVGNNVARAFSLAGTLTIIRFRSAPATSRDIAYIFFVIAAGLSGGVGLYGYGILFVVLMCAILIFIKLLGIEKNTDAYRLLCISVPETLNINNMFDDVFEKYTKSHKLRVIKTAELGSVYRMEYEVILKDNNTAFNMIDDIRCKNGNLPVSLSSVPVKIK